MTIAVFSQVGQRHRGSGPLAATKLGINLNEITDWGDAENTFVDVIKNARGFGTVANYYDPTNFPVSVDANGWPTGDFGITFLSATGDPLGRTIAVAQPSLLGTYHMRCNGVATVTSPDVTVSNVVYTSGTNTTTADVTWTSPSISLSLLFNGTSGGVQNLKLVRPGYSVGTTQVFTTEFLNAIAPFVAVRCMDLLHTNNHTAAATWAGRIKAAAPTQSSLFGVAWEYVIQLANASSKDIWINIPFGVDLTDATSANYVTSLATMMHSTLNAGINVYVEYSNELWNFNFTQFQASVDAANAEIAAGTDNGLNYDSVNIEGYYSTRRTARQLARISDLFRAVYGDAAMGSTIRPVLMSQYVTPYLIEDMLAYIVARVGTPSHYFYGVGGAPYFASTDFTSVNADIASLTSDLSSVFSGFPKGTAYTGGQVFTVSSYKTVADFYGLKTLAYEGGPDIGSGDSPTGSNGVIPEQTASDSRLNTLVQHELANWFGCGNDLFMYYQLAAPPGGIWGMYEDLTLPTQRSAAVLAVAATPLSSFNTCVAS